MKAEIKYRKETEYYIDGRQVTKEEFDFAFPAKPIGEMRTRYSTEFNHPSDALAVHPEQIQATSEYYSKNGIPTDFMADGRPIIKNRSHQKRLLKLHGYINRDGCFGD